MPDNQVGDPSDSKSSGHASDPLSDRGLTWAALLAHWTDLARSAVALPEGEQGRRWRASVAPAITLHALAMALGEVDRLAMDERALAIDRAQILIDREGGALREVWDGAAMPGGLATLIEDAEHALQAALAGGAQGGPLDGPN